jgi:hypothetical protein
MYLNLQDSYMWNTENILQNPIHWKLSAGKQRRTCLTARIYLSLFYRKEIKLNIAV